MPKAFRSCVCLGGYATRRADWLPSTHFYNANELQFVPDYASAAVDMTQIGDSLADCAIGNSVRVLAVDWDRLDPAEGRRLRALGLDAGAVLRLAHRGIFVGRDPIAVEIGRMTIALRRSHALAVSVEPAPEEVPHRAAERPNGGPFGRKTGVSA